MYYYKLYIFCCGVQCSSDVYQVHFNFSVALVSSFLVVLSIIEYGFVRILQGNKFIYMCVCTCTFLFLGISFSLILVKWTCQTLYCSKPGCYHAFLPGFCCFLACLLGDQLVYTIEVLSPLLLCSVSVVKGDADLGMLQSTWHNGNFVGFFALFA